MQAESIPERSRGERVLARITRMPLVRCLHLMFEFKAYALLTVNILIDPVSMLKTGCADNPVAFLANDDWAQSCVDAYEQDGGTEGERWIGAQPLDMDRGRYAGQFAGMDGNGCAYNYIGMIVRDALKDAAGFCSDYERQVYLAVLSFVFVMIGLFVISYVYVLRCVWKYNFRSLAYMLRVQSLRYSKGFMVLQKFYEISVASTSLMLFVAIFANGSTELLTLWAAYTITVLLAMTENYRPPKQALHYDSRLLDFAVNSEDDVRDSVLASGATAQERQKLELLREKIACARKLNDVYVASFQLIHAVDAEIENLEEMLIAREIMQFPLAAYSNYTTADDKPIHSAKEVFDAVLAIITVNDPLKKDFEEERLDALENEARCCPTCLAGCESTANATCGAQCCVKWAYSHVLCFFLLGATIAALAMSIVGSILGESGYNPIFLGFFAAFIYVIFLCFACAPCMLCFTRCFPSTCPPTYFAKLYGTVGVDFATSI